MLVTDACTGVLAVASGMYPEKLFEAVSKVSMVKEVFRAVPKIAGP